MPTPHHEVWSCAQAGQTTAKRKIRTIQPYMAILYEECLELYNTGVRTWDAYKKEFFQLRMLVFDVVCDFPGPLQCQYHQWQLCNHSYTCRLHCPYHALIGSRAMSTPFVSGHTPSLVTQAMVR